jgi:predicted RNA binding protein YcfA (HicA-like mRNA interferase family)
MKVKEAIETIEKDGWFMVRSKGSHRQYKHCAKKGLVTISGHLNDELAKGTLSSIFK